MEIITETKQYFLDTAKNAGEDFYYLKLHLTEVEKWANKVLTEKPAANRQVVMLGIWLHDIGQIIGDPDIDHAINSEIEAKRYLSEKQLDQVIIDQVCHCVRAHRCKDVIPETLEAKIVAFADSSSHMTDIVYICMAQRGEIEEAKLKLERDFRDKSLLPELQKESEPLYLAWRQLLKVYPKTNQ